jgi:tetratricopeptide (TPR) repeat protein
MKPVLSRLVRRMIVFLLLSTIGASLITRSYPSILSLRYQLRAQRILIPILIETSLTSSGPCSQATPQAPQIYRAHVSQAMIDLQLGQEAALSSASSVLLAKAHCWAGKPEEAVKVLRRYEGAYPNHLFGRLEWWRSLGHRFQERKRWDEAVQVYELALVEYPGVPDLHVNLGVALYRRGDGLDTATREIRRAISIRPEGSFYMNMGQLLTEERRYDEADAWYRMGIEAEPGSPWWYQVWAGNALQAKNLAEALSRYQIVIERFPEFAPGYFDMAWAYRLNGQVTEAIQSIERAESLMLAPDPWYYIRAGEIYEWAGQMEKAKGSYRQALELDAVNDSAIQGITRLNIRR